MTRVPLLIWILNALRTVPAPIDLIAPPDPVDDLASLRQLKAITEFQRVPYDNVVLFDARRKIGRTRGAVH